MYNFVFLYFMSIMETKLFSFLHEKQYCVLIIDNICFCKSLHLFNPAKLGHTYFLFCTVALFLLNDSFIVKTMITLFKCYNCILLNPCSLIMIIKLFLSTRLHCDYFHICVHAYCIYTEL